MRGQGRERAPERLQRHLETLCEPSEALGGRTALRRLCGLEEGVWAVEALVPYGAMARALSCCEGGQWIAGPAGLTWVNGRECCWLVEWRTVEEVRLAKQIAAAAGVPVRSWTLGGAARALLKWADIRERHWGVSQQALGGTRWAYQAVTPSSLPDAGLYDLTGAYHQVVERLPSPRVTWTPDGPLWAPLQGQEAERWRTLKAVVRAHKGLRTRVLGCMIGGGQGGQVWCRGKALQFRRQVGPLVTAGLCVARTIYELCGLEAQACGAAYANTDCVVTSGGARREVWDRYGYVYREEARGSADLVALGCYRVGDRQTAWFGSGGRFPVEYPADPLPARLILTQWQ